MYRKAVHMEVRSATLGELASLVGGELFGDEGVEHLLVHQALPLQDAGAGCITLADSTKQLAKLRDCPAVAVVVPQHWQECSQPMLVVDNLHQAFQTIIAHIRPQASKRDAATGISAQAHIDVTAVLGEGCTVAPGASIGPGCIIGKHCRIHSGVHIMAGCQVGDDCELMPGAVLYPDTILGNRVLVHANSVLGAYGFGYRMVDGQHVRTAQLGWVAIDDDVEIGAGTTIDRGTYGPTRIGAGSKLDNQVHVGHNCHLGRHNLICGHVGMAGSCTTGDYVVMAGQVGLADHIHIGDRSQVGAQSGLMQDVPADQVVIGSPALPAKRKMQEYAVSARLPEMRRELRDLQKQVQELQKLLSETSGHQSSGQGACRDAA